MVVRGYSRESPISPFDRVHNADDFLLDFKFNRNCTTIISRYSELFNQLLGVTPVEFRGDLRHQKESMCYCAALRA